MLLLVWAAFWGWFVVASAWNDMPRSLPYAAGGLLMLGGLTVLTLLRPHLGGLALVAAGIAAGLFFDHPFTRGVLALPAILIGIASAAAGLAAPRETAP